MEMVQNIATAALLLFAVGMVAIGLISRKKAATVEGFVLGGRRVGPWMSAFAYGTTYFSAVIFVGYAGTHGWNIGVASIWIGIGNALIGCLLSWKLLAARTRRMTHVLGARTMPELLEGRYLSKNMKIVSACIIFVFLMPYAASVYKGLGMLFSSVFFPDLDPVADTAFLGMSATNLCILIVAVLTAAYLVLGGYTAIALSDFIQGIIMIAGVVVLVVAMTLHPNVGGFGNVLSGLAKVDKGLTDFTGGGQWSFLLTNILLTSLGVFGLPQMAQKFYAIRDQASVKRATVVSTVFALIIGCGAYYVGSLSRLVLSEVPKGGTDAIIPTMLMNAFSDSIPGMILLAVILLLVLSASMSTLSSVVLTSATAITVDLVFRLKTDEKRQINITRLFCLLFVACSFVFATFNFAVIVSIMSYSWGVVAGCFIGPYVWGLFSQKITRAGAWAGMLGALATVLIMTVSGTAANLGGSTLYEAFSAASKNSPLFGVAAMGVSLFLVPIVSLLTQKYKFPKEHVEKVFSDVAA
ncbi:MAG: sodium:solute symporter [Oscillospiraceae bacterium]|jgi:SSS family solute:Na+ symporter/sodium/proline symporter|nr:sodium:solute symporter [Oscillospiraceae bacterium]